MTENSIINNIYNNNNEKFIIEHRSVKNKNKFKKTLIRFVLTNKDKNIDYKNFRTDIICNIQNENKKINCFFPKEIKGYIQLKDAKAFLNIQRFRDDLDFIEKDDILISIKLLK